MTVVGVIYMEDIDNATLGNITPAAGENTVFIAGDDIRVPNDFNKIVGFQAIGATVTQAVITSPSLRGQAVIEVLPIDDAAEPTSNFPAQMQVDNPLDLVSSEALNFQTSNSGAAATETYGLVWLSDGAVTPFTGGNILHIAASSSFTAVVDTITEGALALGSDLPAGEYAVVGFRVEGATCVAARLNFIGQAMNPMVIAYDDEADIETEVFRNGKMGILGSFPHDTPPRIQLLCVAADTSSQVILDIVKTS